MLTILVKTEIAKCQHFTVNQSVLKSGKWIKIGITKDGIYKISYQKLRELGFQNPEEVRVFGNDFGMLPFYNNAYRPEDLIENSILKQNNNIYFFAKGSDIWSYNQDEQMFLPKNHLFSNTAYYFLTDWDSGNNNSIITSTQTNSAAQQTVTQGNFYYCHEEDAINLQMSGRDWFGKNFFYNTSQNFNFQCYDVPESGKIKISVVARSSTNNSFTFSIANSSHTATCNAITSSGLYADRQTVSFDYQPLNSENQTVTINFNKNATSAEGYLDYIILNTREPLKYQSKQLMFRDINSISEGATAKFVISNCKSDLKVMDVTDSHSPTLLNYSFSDSYITFTSSVSELKEFVIFSESDAYEPLFLSKDEQNIPNQNIHAMQTPDFLIITPKIFLNFANQLKTLHSTELNTETVTIEQIFNEFSCGARDVTAIKDAIRYLYKKNNRLKYVLLFGDGSVDNLKNTTNNTNLIPTYQSPNSLNENNLGSFVTDDYFGMLDDNEYEFYGNLDISIGRLPAKNATDAQILVNKIKDYMTKNSGRYWKKNITIVADDEDNNLHAQQADNLAVDTENENPQYNVKKIYIDAYKQISTATGNTYPKAREEILNTINNGTQILYYAGHGGMNFFADERILTNADIDDLTNQKKLPLIITASCNIGHFDYYDRTTDKNINSPAEHLLLNPKGGAIAMLTTTREVLANENFNLSKNIFNYIFDRNLRFGDIIRLAKIKTDDQNMLNFTLLGDPALKLEIPDFDIKVTKINNKNFENFDDTIKALGTYEIECQIVNAPNFNGTAFVTLYDKIKEMSTQNNDGIGAFEYQDFTTKIFEGNCTVNNGIFKFKFLVTKDIDYEIGNGKLSLYADNEEVSATGFTKKIKIGSSETNATADNQGPDIKLYLDNYEFTDGGKTSKSPTLIAELSDSSGINITNANNGHQISLSLDNSSATVSLTDYYKVNKDSYTSGKIEYQLQNLNEGNHTLKLKAFDNYNNSNEETLNFYVSNSDKLQISHLLNYPNPFTDHTSFYFEHNNPQSVIEYELTVFTVSGKIVKVITGSFSNGRTLSEPIEWDGKDDFGSEIARGIYFYRLKIKDLDGKKVNAYEKLLYLK
ncbi:MAG: type IX secretion system sortase PorU [Bacteroidales bacterium]|nr:type IX secretion system sortase PorU [Bacteroidales bacterium]